MGVNLYVYQKGIYAESIAINACLRTKFSSVRNKVNSRMPIYVSAQLTIQDSQSLNLGVILKSQLFANTGWDIQKGYSKIGKYN